MKIHSDWLTALRREGRCTLQVPTLTISFPGRTPQIEYVEIPDNWVFKLQDGKKPAVGRMEGVLYISRLGYEANKSAILEAYVEGVQRKYGRSADRAISVFECYAEIHFERVKVAHVALLASTRIEVERRKRHGSMTPYWQAKLEELKAFPI